MFKTYSRICLNVKLANWKGTGKSVNNASLQFSRIYTIYPLYTHYCTNIRPHESMSGHVPLVLSVTLAVLLPVMIPFLKLCHE